MKLTTNDVRLSLDDLREVAASDESSLFARFLAEELIERGWDTRRLAFEMGGGPVDELVVAMTLCIKDRNLMLDANTAGRIAAAFRVADSFIVDMFAKSRSLLPAPGGTPR